MYFARWSLLLVLGSTIGPLACGNDDDDCGGCYGGMPHPYQVRDQWRGEGKACVTRDDGSTVCAFGEELTSLGPSEGVLRSVGNSSRAGNADAGHVDAVSDGSPVDETPANADPANADPANAGLADAGLADASPSDAGPADASPDAETPPSLGTRITLVIDWTQATSVVDVWVCPSEHMWFAGGGYGSDDLASCTNEKKAKVPSTHWTVAATYQNAAETWALHAHQDRVQIDLTSHIETRGHIEQNCY